MKNSIVINANTYPFIIFLFLAIAIVLFTPVFGEQNALIVGISHWPPMKTNDPEFGGIDVSILKEIEEELDIKVRFIACPWNRCIEMLKTGAVDMVTSFERLKSREEYAIFIEPSYIQVRNRLYKNKYTRVSVSKYEDLYNYTIGAIRGGVYFLRFDNDSSLKLERLATEIQQVRMLEAQRVDVIIGSEYNLDYLILKNNIQGLEKIPLEIPPKEKAYLAMSKRSKYISLIPRIEQIIKKFKKEDTINKIIDNYFKVLIDEESRAGHKN